MAIRAPDGAKNVLDASNVTLKKKIDHKGWTVGFCRGRRARGVQR